MKIPAISSRSNLIVNQLRDQRDDLKGPRIFLEGPKLLEEALKSGLSIETLAFVPTLLESELIQKAIPKAKEVVQITPYVLKGLSDVEAPQGVVAVAKKPNWSWSDLFSRSPRPIVILDRIQDPGNAASIIRTAEAAGAAGLISTPGTARFFSPKALRAAAGSSFRYPVLEHRSIEEIAPALQAAGYGILGSSMTGARSYREIDWKKPWAILLGQEGSGIAEGWSSHLADTISIPMHPPVESLNVAASAAILLYESNRP